MYKLTEEILKQYKAIAFNEGVRYALEYLSELYESIDETDLYKDYMKGDNN